MLRFPRYIMLAAVAGSLASSLHAGSISAIYAFGDSLSDAGNAFIATGGAEPAAPYVNGEFSNGPVWVQDLAGDLGLPPVTASLSGGTDYAVGSAQSGTTFYNSSGAVDLPAQLAAFHAANPTANPTGLYTIWIGANDLAAIPAGASPANIATDLGLIATNIDSAINTLAGYGAKNFLIFDVPDLGKTPESIALGPAVAADESALSADLDSLLINGNSLASIPSLAAVATDDSIRLSVLDTYSLLDGIIANPSAYGFTNVTQPCLTGEVNYAGGTPCANPNQYLFWDQEHPTAAGQALVADAALQVLSPEPASISLAAMGLFCLLLSFRFTRSGSPLRTAKGLEGADRLLRRR